ncbi:hypothetical protein B5X24_HaOG216999 [Helicoverpa armigera]|uniref:BPTI/Kunitz inhibitor domain-containing protein n=1 Tax=Helicoverpa armigera TaxID=29058 RepID=A0A2W1BVA6_HELAM|nr:hypothetical protein B5X24_HaOG216999 [Helicoverpa armigera]
MISLIWGFCFLVCFVHNTEPVRIFDNLIPPPSISFARFQPVVVSKTCMLIPQSGPCRSKISMWYYDPSSNNCSLFDWGGCQGNGNRFNEFSECWDTCMSKPGKYRPRYCGLTFDYGFCFGAVERYYFDSKWKVCKSTIYSGCGGNKNNFYSKEQCDQICRFGNAALTRAPVIGGEAGGTRKVLIINPYNTTPRSGAAQSQAPKKNDTAVAP